MLEQLANERFAYRSYVLVQLYQHWTAAKQPEKAKALEAILDREYPDAIEWLDVCVMRAVALFPGADTGPRFLDPKPKVDREELRQKACEYWQAFRKRVPPKE
jgi:hypothetical protein